MFTRVLTAGILAMAAAQAPAQQIVLDGLFDDWDGVPVAAASPQGNASGRGADLLALYTASNSEALFLRVEVAEKILATEPVDSPTGIGNDLRIYVDADANMATGSNFTESIGAELEIRFGAREVYTYASDGLRSTERLADLGIFAAPSYSSASFEIRIPYTFSNSGGVGASFITGDNVVVWVREESSVDDLGAENGVAVALNRSLPEVVAPAELGRRRPGDVRLLNHNTLNSGTTNRPDIFRRLLQATQPDIICWQEIAGSEHQAALQLVRDTMPLPAGQQWFMGTQFDCVTISRFPFLNGAAVDGNLLSHIDLPDDRFDQDLVVFNVHTPCCTGGNDGRDREHDNLSRTWRDLLNGTGPFAIDPADAMISTGDFNMVGFSRQIHTVRDGDIINNAVYGPDYAPGREEGSLRQVPFRFTHSPLAFTWYSETTSFFAGRLDWMFYTGDSLELHNNYALFTPFMPQEVLAEAGLQRLDAVEAADHLPMIADFAQPVERSVTFIVF